MMSETDFVAKCQHSRHALWPIVRRFFPESSDIEDVLQETYMKAWKRLKTFREESSFDTWVHRIAVNTCIDRKRNKDTRHLQFDGGDRADGLIVEPQQLTESLQFQWSGAVSEALNAIKPEYREVLALVYFEGQSYEEIAETLGIGQGLVKSRVHNGLESLRRKKQMLSKVYTP